MNSLYPSVMAFELLPFDVPVWFDGFPEQDDKYPLFIASITFTAKLRKDHVPCIQIKANSMFGSTEYLSRIDDPVTLSVSSVDLEMWEKHYEMDILSFNGGWKFKGAYGFFDDYIGKWGAIKATAEGGLREIAKLHLNSLYGKFATNPNVTGKFPELCNDILTLTMGPDETRDPVYTAMGVFITAYARRVTLTAAQANYDTFAYADTDSIHLIDVASPQGVVVDPRKLGAWKREYYFQGALFWRAKTYTEKEFDGGCTRTLQVCRSKCPTWWGSTTTTLAKFFTGNCCPNGFREVLFSVRQHSVSNPHTRRKSWLPMPTPTPTQLTPGRPRRPQEGREATDCRRVHHPRTHGTGSGVPLGQPHQHHGRSAPRGA